MPNGPLTPLGRQLRSVLASFSTARGPTLRVETRKNGYNGQKQAASTAAAPKPVTALDEGGRCGDDGFWTRHLRAASQNGADEDGADHRHSLSSPKSIKSRKQPLRAQQNRYTRVDRLTEALRGTGRPSVPEGRKKLDLSHVNVKSARGQENSRITAERHRHDSIPTLENAAEPRESRILATYISQRNQEPILGGADWAAFHTITKADQDLLRSKGFSIEDVEAWAKIVQCSDSLEAARALDKLKQSKGIRSIPFFLVSYLTRRPMTARALRIIVRRVRDVLDYRTHAAGSAPSLSSDAVFMIIIRLMRQARRVWPSLLETLAEMLLHFLPAAVYGTKRPAGKHTHALSFQLNKAMRLLALPSSLEPFKSSAFQQAAIVRTLRFMVEHDPPIEINRDGYRAVVQIQLAQHKSSEDRLWAELKALSWPPWKEDRTAMDAEITRTTHGTSRAAVALQRMSEAGFMLHAFEKLASIYAGWDEDGTPTIQTRTASVGVLPLSSAGEQRRVTAAVWAARIDTTRTVQEAWACYEAYEKENHVPDKAVCLAVFRKLYQEEQRLAGKDSRERSSNVFNLIRLWPGDTREISPLPPSSHLYTYTRRPPPTVDKFYTELRDKGVVLDGDCLAFVVANASSLRKGLHYLYDSRSTYPQVHGLLVMDDAVDLASLPERLVAAFVELLSRFSRIPLSSMLPEDLKCTSRPRVNSRVLARRHVNADHPLVYAADLLQRHRPQYRPMWNSVLRALAHESSLDGLWLRYAEHDAVEANQQREWPQDPRLEAARSANVAFSVIKRMMSLMKKAHLDLDAHGFMSYCSAVENMALGCWTVMQAEDDRIAHDSTNLPMFVQRAVKRMSQARVYARQLQVEFLTLVGDTEHLEEGNGGLQLPKLLHAPSPALLHAHIRALGWLGQYDLMLDTLRWMKENSDDLGDSRARDRNGEAVMRRMLTALRVFLERTWLARQDTFAEEEASSEQAGSSEYKVKLRNVLTGLATPADPSIIAEAVAIVESVEDWSGGWATDEEVEIYCQNERFGRVR